MIKLKIEKSVDLNKLRQPDETVSNNLLEAEQTWLRHAYPTVNYSLRIDTNISKINKNLLEYTFWFEFFEDDTDAATAFKLRWT